MTSWLVKYIDVLENLKADNLETLRQVTADSIHFKDPFNDTQSQRDFVLIMEDMFQKLPFVRFNIHRSVEMDKEAFIHWTFTANSKLTGEFSFEGVSLLKVDHAGKVRVHHDFWDGCEVMRKIPVLGSIIRIVSSKLSHQ